MTQAEWERLRDQSSHMTFKPTSYEGMNERAAIAAFFKILEIAQTDCMDPKITAAEIGDAIDFLTARRPAVKVFCERFREALLIPNQGLRFEATDQALTLTGRQIGQGRG